MEKRIGEECRRKKKRSRRQERLVSIINSSGYLYFIVLRFYNKLIHLCFRATTARDLQR